MPKTLLFGKNETVCLSTHHTTTPTAKAIIDLKLKEKHFFTSITLNSSGTIKRLKTVLVAITITDICFSRPHMFRTKRATKFWPPERRTTIR